MSAFPPNYDDCCVDEDKWSAAAQRKLKELTSYADPPLAWSERIPARAEAAPTTGERFPGDDGGGANPRLLTRTSAVFLVVGIVVSGMC